MDLSPQSACFTISNFCIFSEKSYIVRTNGTATTSYHESWLCNVIRLLLSIHGVSNETITQLQTQQVAEIQWKTSRSQTPPITDMAPLWECSRPQVNLTCLGYYVVKIICLLGWVFALANGGDLCWGVKFGDNIAGLKGGISTVYRAIYQVQFAFYSTLCRIIVNCRKCFLV